MKTENVTGSEEFSAEQDIFPQEYGRISRKNDAVQRKKVRCPGALGVGRIRPNYFLQNFS